MKCLQPALWLFNKVPLLTACIRAVLVCEKCARCHSDVMGRGLIAAYGFQLGCGGLGGTVSQADPGFGGSGIQNLPHFQSLLTQIPD